MMHGHLDRTAPVPQDAGETSADYGYGCLACRAPIPVGRRGPMPVYCPGCAKRLQNLRARSGPACDARSPVPRRRLAARAELLRTAIGNARAELAAVERQQADLAQLARDLDLAAEQARRRNLYGHARNSSAIPAIPGKSA